MIESTKHEERQDPVDQDEARFREQLAFLESVLIEWLEAEHVTVACGSWADGGIAAFIPQGKATLLPAVYEGCFEGVRELRLEGLEHHMHIDLGRVHQLTYSVAPSVCFSGKPSFEVRLLTTGPGGARTSRWSVSFMLSRPYVGDTLAADELAWFFERARRHVASRPDLVRFEVSPDVFRSERADDVRRCLATTLGLPIDAAWRDALRALDGGACEVGEEPSEPRSLELLREALRFREASLVIYRERTLVEFQVEKLAGVFKYVEDGHVSWQLGAFEDHHCHLALGAVTRVLFSAEPVPCQRGRLNYTVWFLVPGACGNPYRSDGYFSVVLNRPYDGDAPRLDLIDQVQSLYRRYLHESRVEADEVFLRALGGETNKGPQCRA
jgi:hypothetical protein